MVVVCVGAALRGLPLPPADGAALHHTAADLGRCLLRRLVRVTVFRHHSVRTEEKLSSSDYNDNKKLLLFRSLFAKHLPSASEVPPGSVDATAGTAALVACVAGNKILGRQLRSHVTH